MSEISASYLLWCIGFGKECLAVSGWELDFLRTVVLRDPLASIHNPQGSMCRLGRPAPEDIRSEAKPQRASGTPLIMTSLCKSPVLSKP